MKMNTDSYFAIGQKHIVSGKPCQDYAMSDKQDEERLVFASVSDGCSTGRNTDVGARLLVLSTAQAIREYWSETRAILPWMVEWVADHRKHAIENISLGLCTEDLLATNIFACVADAGGTMRGFVNVQGDGVVVIKHNDGSMLLSRFDWPNNMPFYPAYTGWRLDSFIQSHGGDLYASVITEERWCIEKNGVLSQEDSVMHTMKDGIDGIKIPLRNLDMIEYLAIFSDGVTQIDNIDWRDAAVMFTSFKSTAGEFAKRRMIVGIKESLKAGKGPLDDISYAVIHINSRQVKGGES